MSGQSGLLLLVTVAAVGILHTIVPDHWAPIVILARQQGWSIARTARAAALAGLGHVTSTLVLGALLWVAGAVLAVRYAHLVSLASAIALIAFGLWIAYGGWKEVRSKHDDDHGHSHYEHGHAHRHADGPEHVHWHEHHEADWHAPRSGDVATHEHGHSTSGRTALLLILGSSPMVEGIPLFLNASTKGVALLGSMAIVFALSTILTYVAMCVAGLRGLQKTSLGPLEQYGEVLSGLFVAAVGVYAFLSS
jgi:ABC-type nickel/cobalt efflux system permease component RcnA